MLVSIRRLKELQEAASSTKKTVTFGKKTYTLGSVVDNKRLKKGMVVAMVTKSDVKPVKILGLSCSDKKYAKGGVKHNSVTDALKKHGAGTLMALESLDSKNDYGNVHYLLTEDDKKEKLVLSLFNGVWSIGAGENIRFKWLK